MAEGREIEFGAEINQDSNFIDIPDGEYDFQVESIERARHNGSEKIPPCNKMVVKLALLMDEDKRPVISEQFILWSTLEWKLGEFFVSIGLKKKGDPLPACNWMAEIPGRRGRCRIKKQADRNDPSKSYSHVDRFLEPAAKDWKNGF